MLIIFFFSKFVATPRTFSGSLVGRRRYFDSPFFTSLIRHTKEYRAKEEIPTINVTSVLGGYPVALRLLLIRTLYDLEYLKECTFIYVPRISVFYLYVFSSIEKRVRLRHTPRALTLKKKFNDDAAIIEGGNL